MTEIHITPIDLRNAPESELEAIATQANRMRAERLPDDPPIPNEELLQGWRNLPTFVDTHAWRVSPTGSDAVVAMGYLDIAQTDHNRHIANFQLSVLPDYRRQGIAKKLLACMLPVARTKERSLLATWSSGRVPSGAAFLEHLGAERGIESHLNQLVIGTVDRDLITHWQESAAERAPDYRLEWCDGSLPDTEFEPFRRMWNDVANSMPRGDLQREDEEISAEQMRQREQGLFARGWQRWLLFVRNEAGAYAGYTEMCFHPNRPYLLEQGGTGVLSAHQNLGLGRWLKAAMLERVMREMPEARFIRANNADTNAPMLAINRALGFAPFSSHTAWQIETEKIDAYLGTRGGKADCVFQRIVPQSTTITKHNPAMSTDHRLK